MNSLNDKQLQLDLLAHQIGKSQDCRRDTVGKLVFGEGNSGADIMFVGEAPGKQEAESGRPFIGRSGKLLRSMIRKIGLDEEQVYFTSPVKYLPKKGTPSKKLIDDSRKFFFRQISIIDPRIIVLLGKTASYAFLRKDVPILKQHGTLLTHGKQIIFITLHPAAVLRFPNKYSQIFVEDFQKLASIADTP